jgi:hypothetical protein
MNSKLNLVPITKFCVSGVRQQLIYKTGAKEMKKKSFAYCGKEKNFRSSVLKVSSAALRRFETRDPFDPSNTPMEISSEFVLINFYCFRFFVEVLVNFICVLYLPVNHYCK